MTQNQQLSKGRHVVTKVPTKAELSASLISTKDAPVLASFEVENIGTLRGHVMSLAHEDGSRESWNLVVLFDTETPEPTSARRLYCHTGDGVGFIDSAKTDADYKQGSYSGEFGAASVH